MVMCDRCGDETEGHTDSTGTQVRGPDGEWIEGWGSVRLLSVRRPEPVSKGIVLCPSCFDVVCRSVLVVLIEGGAQRSAKPKEA